MKKGWAEKWDVIIVGAGASGLMCAIEAGKRGRSVLVLDHAERACGKIRISGGGRCNFTNRNVGSEHYISRNRHFATSALSRFTPGDFLSMLERHGIGYHERERGHLFCNGSSEDVVRMLEAECQRASVQILLSCAISEVRKEAQFRVSTDRGAFGSVSLVVATGGLSMPHMGASNFAFALARQFGLKVTALTPALTPLRFGREDARLFEALTGISIDAAVSCRGASFRGNVLFTHKGLSGPAVLQISSYWAPSESIAIDLLPEVDIRAILEEKRHSRVLPATLLDLYLPKRFARTWCEISHNSRPLNEYSSKDLDSVAAALHNWQIRPAGTEGFNKAEVTLGGVETSELSSKTLESKKVPGLYFTGEAVDVTGHLGGYNLHWAWASGHAAGQYV